MEGDRCMYCLLGFPMPDQLFFVGAARIFGLNRFRSRFSVLRQGHTDRLFVGAVFGLTLTDQG